jgi:hypothetical protein
VSASSSRTWNAVALAMVVSVLHVACGGAAKTGGEPAQAPSGGAQPPSDFTPSSVPAAAPQPGTSASSSVQATQKKAQGDLEAAQRELDVAAGDCRAACKALASMDSAAGHICRMASSPDERVSCEEAKAKVLRARDKVRSTCGGCPGGPRVDRDAPIPSVP